MGYHFGFDIGVSSVGWSVVDDDYNIIELGSNIFPCANAENNMVRRQMRGTRRLLRRRKNRINDYKKLYELATNKIYNEEEIVNSNNNIDLLILKNKALTERISEVELFRVLLNYCKHRGITYLDDAMDVDESEQEEYKDNKKLTDYEIGILENKKLLDDGKLPCEIQLERYNKFGKYRGEQRNIENEKEIAYSNIYNTSSYIKEVEKILDTQSKYYDFINKKIEFRNGRNERGDFIKNSKTFKEHFIDLFTRKREYFEGPGNEKSRTDYGIYKTRLKENGEYETLDNLFSELVGCCTIYNGKNGVNKEYRASSVSFTAETYNLLNDLNNIKIDGEKLNKEQREKIIKKIREADTLGNKKVEKIIFEICGKKDGMIQGARIDKNGENEYHQYKMYRKIRNYLAKEGLSIEDMMPEDKYNKCMDILTLNTDRDNIRKSLKNSSSLDEKNNIKLEYSEDLIELLIKFRMNNNSLFNKWHSFSYRIMNELIPEMLETGEEQQTVLTNMGKFNRKNDIDGNKKLSKSIATEEIYNPVVKRSIRICIDILNALIKKYNSPIEITIEMPRDKNDDEEKKRIKKENDENAKELESIKKKIKEDYNIEINEKHYKNYKNLNMALKLWNEQQGKCLYSGKTINIEELLNNHSMFEIDHIIPLSISFNDSRSNKVLVYRAENQAKGQRTPYEYLNNKMGWGYEQFETEVKRLYKDRKYKNKKENLLFKEDLTKEEVLKGFINRNINDTRYASKVFLNVCQDYFKSKGSNTNVKVVKGSFTHAMRSQIGFIKDRDKDFSHHAIDSVLISFSQMNYNSYLMSQKDIIDIDTGEIINKSKYDEAVRNGKIEEIYKNAMYKSHWKNDIRAALVEAESKIKYWHKVDKKANRQVADQTIYGTRADEVGDVYKINKISIFDKKIKEKFKDFIIKPELVLMYKYDINTYNKLVDIYNEYNEANNPFVAYIEDTGKKIRAGKKENGPLITYIKYKDGKVTMNIDISHKYGHKKGDKKVVLMQLKPYRTDVYYNKEKDLYKFIGIKQNNLKFIDGKICIDEKQYNELLKEEKILDNNQVYNDIEKDGWEFKLSFYKNERISYVKDNFEYVERFSSLNNKNVIETKPINRDKFKINKKDKNSKDEMVDKKQNLVSITTAKNVKKIQLDILGNEYFIEKEKLKLEI